MIILYITYYLLYYSFIWKAIFRVDLALSHSFYLNFQFAQICRIIIMLWSRAMFQLIYGDTYVCINTRLFILFMIIFINFDFIFYFISIHFILFYFIYCFICWLGFICALLPQIVINSVVVAVNQYFQLKSVN